MILVQNADVWRAAARLLVYLSIIQNQLFLVIVLAALVVLATVMLLVKSGTLALLLVAQRIRIWLLTVDCG